MTLFARSPDLQEGVGPQTYAAHVRGVCGMAEVFARDVAQYHRAGDLFFNACSLGAEFHDLGKIDPENQVILSGKKQAKALPMPHWDAGAVHLLSHRTNEATLAAFLIYAHHLGLPDIPDQSIRQDLFLRHHNPEVVARVNNKLNDYLALHREAFGERGSTVCRSVLDPTELSIFLRLALSCLVDADHSDSASHFGDYYEEQPCLLLPEHRLKALDQYVANISDETTKRNKIRSEMYEQCRQAAGQFSIYCCDSPVGTGKTTAVMAHLLAIAQQKNLRRIFIVLPFSNIITQSVATYRKALVLPGEDPERVVVAHHHRAEYGDDRDGERLRQLTVLWQAPVVVTTAVQFFETLAAARPASLRKLHALPGSAIFLDESHAALPAKLWPQAWDWLKSLSKNWGCHSILASGSMSRFWQISEFDEERPTVPDLLDVAFRSRLNLLEKHRVDYRVRQNRFDVESLCEWIDTLPGPRLLIVNTVQSAAVIAQRIAETKGRQQVEHLSTALMPKDRDHTLQIVKNRLNNRDDPEWTLVATSCVEAGVDFSFRSGVREAASLVSLLQTAGRINRNNEYDEAVVWTVQLRKEGLLKEHPAFESSGQILLQLFEEKRVDVDQCTYALREEVIRAGLFTSKISKAEKSRSFKEVEKLFRVVDADTRTVVVDNFLKNQISQRGYVDRMLFQSGCVQLWINKVESLKLEENERYPGVYLWNYLYDDFIGVMAGILPTEVMQSEGFAII